MSEWSRGHQVHVILVEPSVEGFGIWDNIFQLLNADRFGSVLLEEAIRKGGQVRSIDVGLAELILTGGWYI